MPFDVNSETIEGFDWYDGRCAARRLSLTHSRSKTPVGPRDSWPPALKCLVNSCILPMTHCAAIFWGSDLTVIANTAWNKARGGLDGQGTSALRTYRAEALSTLQRVVRGRTVKVGKNHTALPCLSGISSYTTSVDANFFLNDMRDQDSESQILLSTVIDDSGVRQGVLAQLMQNITVEKYNALEGLDKLGAREPLKGQKTDTDGNKMATRNPDMKKGSKKKNEKAFKIGEQVYLDYPLDLS